MSGKNHLDLTCWPLIRSSLRCTFGLSLSLCQPHEIQEPQKFWHSKSQVRPLDVLLLHKFHQRHLLELHDHTHQIGPSNAMIIDKVASKALALSYFCRRPFASSFLASKPQLCPTSCPTRSWTYHTYMSTRMQTALRQRPWKLCKCRRRARLRSALAQRVALYV